MNEVYLRFPEGRKKAFTISYDDNVTQDERLISLMEKYGIKGTFNIIPGWFASEGAVFPEGETYINVTEKKAKEIYDNELVEVANHGFHHSHMTATQAIQKMEDTILCRKKLEEMYDRIITGFAYPYGLYDEELIQVLRDAGISYARTVFSTHCFSLPEDWMELNPTCHHADEQLMELTREFLEDEVKEQPYLFYVWGHTFEFDEQDNWDIAETLFARVSENKDIWYATNGEIYTYHMAFQSLVYSADGRRIYNPSGTDLWAEVNGRLYALPSGQEICLS